MQGQGRSPPIQIARPLAIGLASGQHRVSTHHAKYHVCPINWHACCYSALSLQRARATREQARDAPPADPWRRPAVRPCGIAIPALNPETFFLTGAAPTEKILNTKRCKG